MCRAHSETRPQFLQCKDVRKCNPYFIQKGKCAIVERIVEGHIKKFILKPGAKVNAPSSPVFLVITSSLFFFIITNIKLSYFLKAGEKMRESFPFDLILQY